TEGINALKKAIHYGPDTVKAYNNLGVAYINIGKYAEAVEVLNEAIRLKPDYLQARNNLAVAKSRLKEAESK
ncbi:MAG: hypothetical protein COV68_10730, partial [Nitrospirae bacterium CG11_big_fil_rev_8_21_14_0_20_41_14]